MAEVGGRDGTGVCVGLADGIRDGDAGGAVVPGVLVPVLVSVLDEVVARCCWLGEVAVGEPAVQPPTHRHRARVAPRDEALLMRRR